MPLAHKIYTNPPYQIQVDHEIKGIYTEKKVADIPTSRLKKITKSEKKIISITLLSSAGQARFTCNHPSPLSYKDSHPDFVMILYYIIPGIEITAII